MKRIAGTLYEDRCTFMISRCVLLRMRNVAGKSRGRISKHVFCVQCPFFPKIVPFVR